MKLNTTLLYLWKSGMNSNEEKKRANLGAARGKERWSEEISELVADVEPMMARGGAFRWSSFDHSDTSICFDFFSCDVLRIWEIKNESDIKMFYECCRASRRAVKKAKIELWEKFLVRELSSISTLELAWEGYPWGTRRRLPNAGWKLRCCYVAPRIFQLLRSSEKRSQITSIGARRKEIWLELEDEW